MIQDFIKACILKLYFKTFHLNAIDTNRWLILQTTIHSTTQNTKLQKSDPLEEKKEKKKKMWKYADWTTESDEPSAGPSTSSPELIASQKPRISHAHHREKGRRLKKEGHTDTRAQIHRWVGQPDSKHASERNEKRPDWNLNCKCLISRHRHCFFSSSRSEGIY